MGDPQGGVARLGWGVAPGALSAGVEMRSLARPWSDGRFSSSALWVLGLEAGYGVAWQPCGASVAASMGGQRATTSCPAGKVLDGAQPLLVVLAE